ncbi:MAG: thioredoxin domain-containing protein [Desulfocurvibacter africanus]
MKKRLVPGFMPVRMALGLVLLLGSLIMASHPAFAEEVPQVPVPGMVTMVDLGAKSCIPCKMMEPILAELEKEYEGRAAIVFIDVYKHHEQVERFDLRAIPTQIFFDKNGREVKRHMGFMDKASIEAELAKLGVK